MSCHSPCELFLNIKIHLRRSKASAASRLISYLIQKYSQFFLMILSPSQNGPDKYILEIVQYYLLPGDSRLSLFSSHTHRNLIFIDLTQRNDTLNCIWLGLSHPDRSIRTPYAVCCSLIESENCMILWDWIFQIKNNKKRGREKYHREIH